MRAQIFVPPARLLESENQIITRGHVGLVATAPLVTGWRIASSRRPTKRLSPPRSRQRTLKFDPSQLGMLGAFKTEMKTMLRETMDEQYEKSDRRFEKVEKKLMGFAKVHRPGSCPSQERSRQNECQYEKLAAGIGTKLEGKTSSLTQAHGGNAMCVWVPRCNAYKNEGR